MAAGQYLSIPTAAAGLTPASAASAWGYGTWVEVVSAASNTTSKYISGFSFQITNVPALDTSTEQLFEIGTGASSAEVTKVQVPYSIRADTLANYYMTNIFNVYFPEPMVISTGTRIAVRVADSLTSAITYNGVKLLYLEANPTFSQTAYRYYEDGVEASSTAIDAQDTNITRDVNSDSNLQLRVRLQHSTSGDGDSTDDYQLQYELNDSGLHADIGKAPVLADSYAESNNDTTFNLGGGAGIRPGLAQSVTGDGNTVLAAKFYLKKTSTPTGSAVAKIYAHSGTFGTSSVPSGAALALSESFDVSTLTGSYQLVVFNFTGSNQVTLTNATNYVLSIEYDGGTAGAYVQCGSDGSSAAHSGNFIGSNTGAPLMSWTAFNTFDLCFYLYTATSSGAVTSYNSASLTDGNATTNRLGAGSGSFVAGEISEDGLVDDHQITVSSYTEHLYSLTLVSSALANNDTLDFRVLRNNAATGMTYTVTPRITASKSSSASVTPGVAALTLSSFAPVIAHSILAGLATLSLATFAPTVAVSNNQSVTPSSATLTTSTFAPTVTPTNNQSVTPSVASLSTTGYAPIIATTDHKTATPGVLALTTTGHAPQVNLALTPALATLTTTSYIPTVSTTANVSVSPSLTSLTLTSYEPVVALSVTPSTVPLSTSTFAPTVTVSDHKTVTPSVATLAIATFASVVTATDNKLVTPSVVSLTLTSYAPSVAATGHVSVVPDAATLATQGFSPSVSVGDAVVVTPSTLSLTLSTFAPTVSTTDHKLVTPSVASLSITSHAPTVTASDHKTATPSIAELAIATFAPTVSTADHKTVSPEVLAIALQAFPPTVTTTAHQTVTPETAALSLTLLSPTVTASDQQVVTPSLATLVTATYSPTVVTMAVRIPVYELSGSRPSTQAVSGSKGAQALSGSRTTVSTTGTRTSQSVSGGKPAEESA